MILQSNSYFPHLDAFCGLLDQPPCWSPSVSCDVFEMTISAAVESIPKRKSKMGTATTMLMSDQIQKLKSEVLNNSFVMELIEYIYTC